MTSVSSGYRFLTELCISQAFKHWRDLYLPQRYFFWRHSFFGSLSCGSYAVKKIISCFAHHSFHLTFLNKE